MEDGYECKKCGNLCNVEQSLHDSEWFAELNMFMCTGEYYSSCCDAGFIEFEEDIDNE